MAPRNWHAMVLRRQPAEAECCRTNSQGVSQRILKSATWQAEPESKNARFSLVRYIAAGGPNQVVSPMRSDFLKLPSCLVVACVVGASASAQPTGYHVGAAVVLPDSLVEVLARGRFRASIVRVAANANDARLIAAAEQLYASPDAIIATATTAEERKRLLATAPGIPLDTLKVSQRAAGSPADRWWLDSFDATWIPFAVTAGAVDYYLGRLHDYAAGRSPFGFSATDGADHGSLSYTAKVVSSSEPGVARVVELQLQWDYSCGYLCAMEFRHTRRVFFDATGRAIRLEGDERPEVDVS